MKFKSTHQTNRFLNRKDQFQLFMLVALLGLIIIAMKKTAEPEFWYWMFPPEARNEHRESEPSSNPQPDQLAFVISPDDNEINSREFTPETDLSIVKDDTLGVSPEEAASYFSLLDQVASLENSTLSSQGLGEVGYSVLMDHPDEYRGKLIRIEGNLRRLTLLPPEDDLSGKRYYEGWVFTKSSGVNPYRIICIDADETLPVKQDYEKPLPVRLTGYFFKKQAYAAEGGLNIAPLILAKKLEMATVSAPPRQPVSRIQKPLLVYIVIAGGLFLFVLWGYQKSDAHSRLRMQRGKYLGQRLWVPEGEPEEIDEEEKFEL